ncbi:MAG TPA: ribosome maturation factor RimM [Longimicrobiaceae bacterium]|nr:ribosome maturation factor RimM [Longimicrobiaceae bacterium]
MADPTEYLSVGTIRRPHGVRGELAVGLETDRPRSVFRTGRVLLLGDAGGRPTGGTLTVEKVRSQKDGLLLKAAEFAGRTPELEALRGRTLLIPAAEAAPVAAGEVHYRDLVGMAVWVGGERLGTVRSVVETAAGELLAVERPGRAELLLPFVEAWVRRTDPRAGVLEIEPPEGLLEL